MASQMLETGDCMVSPRVCYVGRLPDSAPVGTEVVLGGTELTAPGQGGGHLSRSCESRLIMGTGGVQLLYRIGVQRSFQRGGRIPAIATTAKT